MLLTDMSRLWFIATGEYSGLRRV